MRYFDFGDFIGALVSMISIALIVGLGAAVFERERVEREAIRHGVAAYQLDADFNRVFVWKTNLSERAANQ